MPTKSTSALLVIIDRDEIARFHTASSRIEQVGKRKKHPPAWLRALVIASISSIPTITKVVAESNDAPDPKTTECCYVVAQPSRPSEQLTCEWPQMVSCTTIATK